MESSRGDREQIGHLRSSQEILGQEMSAGLEGVYQFREARRIVVCEESEKKFMQLLG